MEPLEKRFHEPWVNKLVRGRCFHAAPEEWVDTIKENGLQREIEDVPAHRHNAHCVYTITSIEHEKEPSLILKSVLQRASRNKKPMIVVMDIASLHNAGIRLAEDYSPIHFMGKEEQSFGIITDTNGKPINVPRNLIDIVELTEEESKTVNLEPSNEKRGELVTSILLDKLKELTESKNYKENTGLGKEYLTEGTGIPSGESRSFFTPP